MQLCIDNYIVVYYTQHVEIRHVETSRCYNRGTCVDSVSGPANYTGLLLEAMWTGPFDGWAHKSQPH